MIEQQNDSAVFVVAGFRPFSLGHSIANELAKRAPKSTVVAFDIEGAATSRENLTSLILDLNPLGYSHGFKAWSLELDRALRNVTPNGKPPLPIRAVVLTIAKYDVGKFEDTSTSVRSDMLGINLLAKFELLHAVMRVNKENGFDNAKVLDVIDFGSLHAIRKTSRRALYNATKAATLRLCEILSRGSEVRRALHVAPGCIDTTMLHWNHWTLKEQGDAEFPERVRRELPSLYSAIFQNGDEVAFQSALKRLQIADVEVPRVFERYRSRRKRIAESEDGIIRPEDLASYIASLIFDRDAIDSGVIEVKAPSGAMKVTQRSF